MDACRGHDARAMKTKPPYSTLLALATLVVFAPTTARSAVPDELLPLQPEPTAAVVQEPAPAAQPAKAPSNDEPAVAESPAPAVVEADEPSATAEQPAAAEDASAPAKKPLRVFQARNQNLEYAKELVKRGRYQDALEELDVAAKLPGNSLRLVAEMHATRAQALLLQDNPNETEARGLLVEMLHVDPEATMLADAPEAVQAVLESLRAEQVLVLHERIVVARAGRPMRVRARLVDPQNQVSKVKLYYRGNHLTKYSMEPMKKGPSSWVGYLREPSILAPEGVDDEYLIDYYITAENAAGEVVDSNGRATDPITTEISATRNEEAGLTTGVDLTAIQALREGPLPQPEVVVPVVPLYKRWYVLTGAGVVVAGAVVGTIIALSGDGELPEPRIELP